jgi:hypothetical protein
LSGAASAWPDLLVTAAKTADFVERIASAAPFADKIAANSMRWPQSTLLAEQRKNAT